MANKSAPGFVLFSSTGEILGDYSSSVDTSADADALRGMMLDLAPGEYWLMTIRSDRYYLNRLEAGEGGDALVNHPAAHAGRFLKYTRSPDADRATKELRRSLLAGAKVPLSVVNIYLAAVD